MKILKANLYLQEENKEVKQYQEWILEPDK